MLFRSYLVIYSAHCRAYGVLRFCREVIRETKGCRLTSGYKFVTEGGTGFVCE